MRKYQAAVCLLSTQLLKYFSLFRNNFLYFAAFFRLGSQAGSRDEFPRLAYTGPHYHAETCVSTRISNKNNGSASSVNSFRKNRADRIQVSAVFLIYVPSFPSAISTIRSHCSAMPISCRSVFRKVLEPVHIGIHARLFVKFCR